jgi:hypothetical protein
MQEDDNTKFVQTFRTHLRIGENAAEESEKAVKRGARAASQCERFLDFEKSVKAPKKKKNPNLPFPEIDDPPKQNKRSDSTDSNIIDIPALYHLPAP